MTEPAGDVRVLVELIAKSLVDTPDEVFVEKFDDDVIELEVAESEVGKVIGRQGRTAQGSARFAERSRPSSPQALHARNHRVAWTVSSESKGEFITLARVVKTQGRHGEVAAETHSDVPGRFAEGMKLFALPKAEDVRRELEVEDLWPHKGLVVLKFRGVDSMSDAELLIGSELQVPRPNAPAWSRAGITSAI